MITSTGFRRFAMSACVVSAAAVLPPWLQAEVLDLGEIPNGVVVDVPAGKGAELKGVFKVVKDGAVRIMGSNGVMIFPYYDAEYKQALSGKSGYVNGRQMFTYQCKEGDLLYMHNNMAFGNGTIQVSNGDIPIVLVSTTPSDKEDSPNYYGGAFSPSRHYVVQFMFDNIVSVKSASLTANGETRILTPVLSNNFVEVEVAATIMDMYGKGLLKKGDTINVTLEGIAESGNPTNMYNGDGKASVSFVVAEKPLELISTRNTPDSGMPVVLSYYAPGNPDAVVELTFSGDLSTEEAPVAGIQYLSSDSRDETVYEEALSCEVSGATLSIDLSGKRRRQEDMRPDLSEDKYSNRLSLFVRNIKGKDGQYVYNGRRAAAASYFYSYDIKTLQYTIASDFTPTPSTALQEGQSMEIYVMNGSKISFSGVNFAYKANGAEASVEVPATEVKVEPDSYNADDTLISLTVPALPDVDAGSEVTVTLSGMLCSDGLDHSDNIRAVYTDYTSGIYTPATALKYDVYNMQGICIMRQASANELKTLPKGIYMAGGKKIIVR